MVGMVVVRATRDIRWTAACAGCGRYGSDVAGSPVVFDNASITGSSPVLFVYVATRSTSGAPTVTGLTANGTALVPVATRCPSCGTGGINDPATSTTPATRGSRSERR